MPIRRGAYRRIELTFRVSGEGLTENAISQAIQLSQEKILFGGCDGFAVVAEIVTKFEIIK